MAAGNAFLAYAEQIQLPILRSNDIVLLDNLGAYKVPLVPRRRMRLEERFAALTASS